MDTNEPTETPQETATTPQASALQAQPARGLRLPSPRASAVLATVMLGIGVAGGAALGPGPDSSFAGDPGALAQRLPALLAAIAARRHAAAPAGAQASAPASEAEPAASAPRHKRKHRHAGAAASAPATSASETTPSSSETSETSAKPGGGSTHQAKLPAISSVWLIELAGGTFSQALATPAAAPYIDAQLVPTGTLLSGWSALQGSAFAGEATLAEPVSAEATPPLLHSIVQPPCPEGAAGAACAAETPGQLTTADEFLKATLATITSTPAYREHGLVVVTFASVAVPTQAGLPAGASSATLTYKPPAGVLLLSPFAQKGSRASVTYNPTSPRQSLEKLLH
jgi:hypothetical protein